MSNFPYPDWRPLDGPDEWIYIDKPLGSRCLWTCRWQTQVDTFGPNKILPVDKLTKVQVWHELRDCLALFRHRGQTQEYTTIPNNKDYEKALNVYLAAESAEGINLENTRKTLSEIRERYPIWTSNWSRPEGRGKTGEIYPGIKFRPSWGLNDWPAKPHKK